MTAKRIVLIILCVLLTVMVILFAVVGSKFAPLLSILKGGQGGKEPSTAPSTGAPQQTTVPSDPQQTTAPTEPTYNTEPGHEHEFVFSKVVEAGCGTMGYTVYECSCGKTDLRDMVDAIEHNFSAGKKVSATCEEQGYTAYECSNCGYVDRRNVSDPLGHEYVLVETKEPGCVQDGYDLYRCETCQGEMKENEVIAPGHVCEEWVETTAPGPGQPGEDSAVCTVCGETVTRPCQLELRGVLPERYDTHHVYTVLVGTRTTDRALVYTVIDYSCSNEVYFHYREDGLAVEYCGQELTTLQALQEIVLTIDENGQMIVGDMPQPPTPSDPTVPSEPTEPSEPSDPTEPSEPSEPSDPTEPSDPGTATEEGTE